MFIFSNLATSLDGKIATQSRVHFPLGTPADRKMMQVLRKKADAVIIGASTLRAYRGPILVSGAKRQPVNIVVSNRLDGFSTAWRFFTDRRTRKILFVSADAPETRVKKFSRYAEIYRLKKPSPKKPIAAQIVEILKTLRIESLLVEGGGGLMWDFVSPNLLDELYVTLTPRILGGESAPTLVDGKGFKPKEVVNLKLKSSRRLGHELYLVYSKTGRRGP